MKTVTKLSCLASVLALAGCYDAPQSIPFTAWVGSDNAEVTFHAEKLPDTTYISSSDTSCPITDVSGCNNLYQIVVDGVSVLDPNFVLNQPSFMAAKLPEGETYQTIISDADFANRYNYQLVSFKGKLWLIGGAQEIQDENSLLNDVWSSEDGRLWIKETDQAAFSARQGHKVVTFNNKLWLYGGYDGTSSLTDTWSSSDGITWQKEENANWPGLDGTEIAELNGKLWAVGGYSAPETEILYSSEDGINWVQSDQQAGFSTRSRHQVVSTGDALFLIGGRNFPQAKNDIWKTSDGVNWQQILTSDEIAGRYDHRAVYDGTYIWISGGNDNNSDAGRSDLWRSTDGVQWQKVTDQTAFGNRKQHHFIAADDQLFVIGSKALDDEAYFDVWASEDGDNWQNRSNSIGLPAIDEHEAIAFKDRLWVFGGDMYGFEDNNQIWSSADGFNWQMETANAAFPGREDAQVVQFNDQLWLIGGYQYPSDAEDSIRFNDIWRSDDGKNWVEVQTQGDIFSPRREHQVIVFDNKLWVIGGSAQVDPNDDDYRRLNDVWSSANGINWTQVTDEAAFAGRDGHEVVVFNNQMWLMAGAPDSQGPTEYLDDIYVSSNGADWQQVDVTGSPFTARADARATVYDGKIWMVGGTVRIYEGDDQYGTPYAQKDVYYSANGSEWNKVTDSAAFPVRASHQLLVFKDKLTIIGGDSGYRNGGHSYGDVWQSSNGSEWRKAYQGELLPVAN